MLSNLTYCTPGAHSRTAPVITPKRGDDAVYSAYAQPVKNLQAHREALSAVGSKAHLAATRFSDMDVRNAATMRAVRCGSDT